MATEKDDKVDVGRRIRRLRQAQEITSHELAKRAKVSPGYMSEVERGIPAVSMEKLKQIADGLGVPLDSLLSDSTPESASGDVVQIPAALSAAAEQRNLSHRATLALLQGKRSLTARRSQRTHGEWTVDEWLKFYDQVKDYLPEC